MNIIDKLKRIVEPKAGDVVCGQDEAFVDPEEFEVQKPEEVNE